jgi:putative transposase
MLDSDLTHYQRALPHRLPPGENIFITFRLAGTLPQSVVESLRAEWDAVDAQRAHPDNNYARQKRYFGRYDTLLDGASHGPTWLRESAVAELVKTALHHCDDDAYLLVCYCLMPNHAHMV